LFSAKGRSVDEGDGIEIPLCSIKKSTLEPLKKSYLLTLRKSQLHRSSTAVSAKSDLSFFLMKLFAGPLLDNA
jgi:hypothetical protein